LKRFPTQVNTSGRPLQSGLPLWLKIFTETGSTSLRLRFLSHTCYKKGLQALYCERNVTGPCKREVCLRGFRTNRGAWQTLHKPTPGQLKKNMSDAFFSLSAHRSSSFCFPRTNKRIYDRKANAKIVESMHCQSLASHTFDNVEVGWYHKRLKSISGFAGSGTTFFPKRILPRFVCRVHQTRSR